MVPDPKSLSDEELVRYYDLIPADCPDITKVYADQMVKRLRQALDELAYNATPF